MWVGNKGVIIKSLEVQVKFPPDVFLGLSFKGM